MATKQVEAKCHCGSVNFLIELPEAKLPLGVHLCHCNICRHLTGAPCTFHCPLPKETKFTWINGSSEANMTAFASPGLVGAPNFCTRCGCHIASIDIDGGNWYISPSITNDTKQEFFQLRTNAFTKSSKDGGLSNMLQGVGSRQLKEWNPDSTDDRSKVVEHEPEVGKDGEPRLRAECHCGGVSFTIKRPSEQVVADDFLGTFVSPLDKSKWLASFDVCNDCRLVTGTHVIGWCYTSLSSCEPAIGRDLRIGTSKTYESSPGVLRAFCGQCGATIFYSCESRNVDGKAAIDVATGILKAPEGSLAENWLTWRSRVSHVSSGYDGEFASSLQKGMDQWTVGKYGKTIDFNIG